jgi:uncharacterized protein
MTHPTLPEMTKKPLSPCIQVCTIDPETGQCRGCFRTLDEIARWGSLDDEERRRIMAALPGRRKGAGC